jgi:hypothetical protein
MEEEVEVEVEVEVVGGVIVGVNST